MKLSVVIINFKTPKQLCECIESIYATTKDIDDIIVVDNHSEDDSVRVVREKFPEIRTIASHVNGGFAMAANWGIRIAQHETILILNPDIIVKEGAIRTLYDKLHSEENIGIVAPKLLNFDGTLQYSCSKFHKLLTPVYRRTVLGRTRMGKKELSRFEMTDWDHNDERDVDWAIGAALMLKRDIVEKVGLMDSRFFLYFEDVDLCRRVWEAGYRVVYVPSAVMLHEHKRLSAYQAGVKSIFNRVTRIHIYSWLQYFWKHRGKLRVKTGAHERGSK